MADTTVTALPFFVEHPLVQIGATGSAVEFSCAASHVAFSPDQEENTAETFCGIYTSYKPTKWTLTVTVLMSYGATGVWALLEPLQNTLQPFEVQPALGAASVDNPSFSGTAWVKAFPPIDAGIGEASEIDIELAVQGDLVSGITAPALADVEADDDTDTDTEPAADETLEPAPA